MTWIVRLTNHKRLGPKPEPLNRPDGRSDLLPRRHVVLVEHDIPIVVRQAHPHRVIHGHPDQGLARQQPLSGLPIRERLRAVGPRVEFLAGPGATWLLPLHHKRSPQTPPRPPGRESNGAGVALYLQVRGPGSLLPSLLSSRGGSVGGGMCRQRQEDPPLIHAAVLGARATMAPP